MNDSQSPPDFRGNINFNAQHSPVGAFMSFTCGNVGTRGGFGLQIGKPGNQDLYVGVKDGARGDDAPLRCLPFFRSTRGGGAGAADFLVEQAGPSEQNAASNVRAIDVDQIRRGYGWASDRWATDEFSFAIYSPFASIPDPAIATPAMMRRSIAPAIVAELTVDNTRGTTPKTGFFAMNFNEPGWVPIAGSRFEAGFAQRGQAGVLGEVTWDDGGSSQSAAPQLFCRWTPDGGLLEPVAHRLGSCPGLAFDVPAGQRRTLRLALGCYLAGNVTTGIEASYLYTRYFASLADVLTRTLSTARVAIDDAAEQDRQLLESGLSDDQQFLLAHATRSYYGSTQLLDAAGEPLFVVNEGEYCMMNTLDLSVDQMFWELRQNPWVVRNILDRFTSHYSYVDEVKKPDGTLSAGGLSFTHDMGAHNNFSPTGHSSYELPELTGCFSYMTAEQLCNWSLLAATYVAHTGNVAWARQHARTIAACVTSLAARGGADRFVQYDSSRCGKSGAEITTYDSLDHSLAQTRNNVYIAVKCWASYLGLAAVARAIGDEATARTASEHLERVAAAVSAKAGADGVIPAVFEPGNPGHASRILPACEGLLYAIDWRRTALAATTVNDVMALPHTARMVDALRGHTLALLNDPARGNVFADGGLKLSSTSNNSWMSKIALFQHVARELFGANEDAAMKQLFADADAAHVKWQTDGSSYWACCDQIVSGVAKGSRYYPRVISASVWLDERRGGDAPAPPRGRLAAATSR